jgi:hypothetical protein
LDRPHPEGVRPAAPACSEGPPTAASPGADTLLSELAADYAFFHHGMLHAVGGLEVDVLREWAATHAVPESEAAQVHLFEFPLFSGLGWPWDHALGLVPRPRADSLYDHLRAISIRDPRRGTLARATLRTLVLADPLLARRAIVPAAPPTIVVAAFGLDATYGRVEFEPPCDRAPPRLVRRPPDPMTCTLAAALAAHDEKPFAAIEEDPVLESHLRVPP